jgi:hypothetical protein
MANLFDFGGSTTPGLNTNPTGGTGMVSPNTSQESSSPATSTGGLSYTANGYSTGTGIGTANPISGLGINLPSNSLNQILGGTWGPMITHLLNSGTGYNSQVLSALINQIQPQVNEGIASLGASAGAAGTRFGSGYQVGLGDYLSQVNANENTMAANLYENSVQNTLGLLGNILPLQAQYTNNKGGFTSSLISSLIGAFGPTLAGGLGQLLGINTGTGKSGSIPTSGTDYGYSMGTYNPNSTGDMSWPTSGGYPGSGGWDIGGTIGIGVPGPDGGTVQYPTGSTTSGGGGNAIGELLSQLGQWGGLYGTGDWANFSEYGGSGSSAWNTGMNMAGIGISNPENPDQSGTFKMTVY